jgi:hypothetical protein
MGYPSISGRLYGNKNIDFSFIKSNAGIATFNNGTSRTETQNKAADDICCFMHYKIISI